MTRFRLPLALPLVGIALLAACGGDAADPPADSAAAVAAPASSSASSDAAATALEPLAADEPCPMYGAWRRCSVIERLERAGFGVTPLPDSVRQEGLGIAGEALRLGAAELQLYLYADSADAARAAAALDPDDAEPADASGIRRAPAVIRSVNLVALLFNNNDRQLERVQLALTAGLPARGPDVP